MMGFLKRKPRDEVKLANGMGGEGIKLSEYLKIKRDKGGVLVPKNKLRCPNCKKKWVFPEKPECTYAFAPVEIRCDTCNTVCEVDRYGDYSLITPKDPSLDISD